MLGIPTSGSGCIVPVVAIALFCELVVNEVPTQHQGVLTGIGHIRQISEGIVIQACKRIGWNIDLPVENPEALFNHHPLVLTNLFIKLKTADISQGCILFEVLVVTSHLTTYNFNV